MIAPRRPLPARLTGAWALAVAGLGLALAGLGPPAGPPPPLSPRTALAAALARLPAGARGARVFELEGWRSVTGWRFAVYLAFRSGPRLRGASVLLPAPPVGGVLPVAVDPATYRQAWPPGRLQPALLLLAPAGCVAFLAPGPPGCR